MNYCSTGSEIIYQVKPHFSIPSHHLPKGWTDCVLGYVREANQWARCINRNRRKMHRGYSWVVHLNHNDELAPAVVTSIWMKACNILRKKGIVCLWVREPNRRNKVHYHIIIKNMICESDLKRAFEDAMPPRSEFRWRKRVERIKSQYHLAHYVVKAKIAGQNSKGRFLKDLYAPKRLLFRPNIGFKKVGVIGAFWEGGGSKKNLWKEIQVIEKRISDGLQDPVVRRAAQYVHDIVGDEGAYCIKHIERSFGYWAMTDGVQQWVNQVLLAEKQADPCTI